MPKAGKASSQKFIARNRAPLHSQGNREWAARSFQREEPTVGRGTIQGTWPRDDVMDRTRSWKRRHRGSLSWTSPAESLSRSAA